MLTFSDKNVTMFNSNGEADFLFNHNKPQSRFEKPNRFSIANRNVAFFGGSLCLNGYALEEVVK